MRNKASVAVLSSALLAFFLCITAFPGGASLRAHAAGDDPGRLAPVNPAFTEYLNRRDAGLTPSTDEEGHPLGLIPSPRPPEKHSPNARLDAAAVQSLPSRYDLRDPNGDGDTADSLLTPVKNQGACGSCWAFGSYGSLESQEKKSLGISNDFSENNLNFCSGFGFSNPCAVGGNIDMTAAYLARFDGPIDESIDPYDPFGPGAVCTPSVPTRYIDNVMYLPTRASTNDNAYIKQAVLDHGALYVSFTWDSSCYNSSTHTFYKSSSYEVNHAVIIVGWDDDMTATPAPGRPSPPGPGVFIARNSWGTSWGEAGFFYISYYDVNLAFFDLAAFDDRDDALLDFDRVFYYDELGSNSHWGAGSETGWGANIFEPDVNGALRAISFFASHANTAYDLFVYKDFNGTNFSTQLASKSGTVPYAGYYTVILDQPVPVAKGVPFGAAVKFTTPGYNYPVAIQQYIEGLTPGIAARPGQSYVSQDGVAWSDYNLPLIQGSVCIKALVKSGVPDLLAADFTASPSPGLTGQPVQFTDASTGAIQSWRWKFGDGAVSTARNPVHVFKKAGVFNVELTVTGLAGSSSKTTAFTVNDGPPIVDFKGVPELIGKAPLRVRYINSTQNKVTSWKWDFGDGSGGSKAKNPVHVYRNAGVYAVSLTATSPAGEGSKTFNDYITVYKQPVARFTAKPARGRAPLDVTFANLSAGDITWRHWDFGDGTASDEASPPVHRYPLPGRYKVSLATGNDFGAAHASVKTIVVYKPKTFTGSAGQDQTPPARPR